MFFDGSWWKCGWGEELQEGGGDEPNFDSRFRGLEATGGGCSAVCRRQPVRL